MARVVYGVHPVREALRSGKVQALFVAEGETGPALKDILDAARVELRAAACTRAPSPSSASTTTRSSRS